MRGTHPKLVIVLAGKNPASLSYIRQKQKAAESIGIECDEKRLPENVSFKQLQRVLNVLNRDSRVHGVLVQLPLPRHLQASAVIGLIDPEKDVDGFHPLNAGQMFLEPGQPGLSPCTPLGVIKLLDYYRIPIAGKAAVVIGRSNIVGKPLAFLLLARDATVTVCHSKTPNLRAFTRAADIVVSAVGKPGMLTSNFVKKGAVVIDVAVVKVKNRLVGDCDFDSVSKKASWVTPVPGGVGPMTVACLMENVVFAAEAKVRDR